MAIERERKFLVKNTSFINDAIEKREIKQAYLSVTPTQEIRVSIRDNFSHLCIKQGGNKLERKEYEYRIPLQEAEELYNNPNLGKLNKTRYIIPAENGLKWEVDVFHGNLNNLIVAEIEEPSQNVNYSLPNWIDCEVTGNPNYYNSYLATNTTF